MSQKFFRKIFSSTVSYFSYQLYALYAYKSIDFVGLSCTYFRYQFFASNIYLKNQIFGRLSIICNHLSFCQQFCRTMCKRMKNTIYENTEKRGSFSRPCNFIIVFASFFTLTITVSIYQLVMLLLFKNYTLYYYDFTVYI